MKSTHLLTQALLWKGSFITVALFLILYNYILVGFKKVLIKLKYFLKGGGGGSLMQPSRKQCKNGT